MACFSYLVYCERNSKAFRLKWVKANLGFIVSLLLSLRRDRERSLGPFLSRISVPSSLLKTVNKLVQTCWRVETTSANGLSTTCHKMSHFYVRRPLPNDWLLAEFYVAFSTNCDKKSCCDLSLRVLSTACFICTFNI